MSTQCTNKEHANVCYGFCDGDAWAVLKEYRCQFSSDNHLRRMVFSSVYQPFQDTNLDNELP